jgi:hypothetical protein
LLQLPWIIGEPAKFCSCDRPPHPELADFPVGPIVGPNVAVPGWIALVSMIVWDIKSPHFQAGSRAVRWRRVASHARGRRFETRRAHEEKSLEMMGFPVAGRWRPQTPKSLDGLFDGLNLMAGHSNRGHGRLSSAPLNVDAAKAVGRSSSLASL